MERPTRKAFVVRLDAATLAALDQAAQAAELSREAYVRRLILAQLAPRASRHTIRGQRHRDTDPPPKHP